jgi:hypothetical protein
MTHPTEDSRAADPIPKQAEGLSIVGIELKHEIPSEPAVSLPPWGLSFYLFIEPFTIGKMVVDLSTAGGGPGPELLRRAGAVEVLTPSRIGLPIPFPSGGADLLICGLTEADMASDSQRALLFAETHRVLRSDGICVVRVVAEALGNAAVGVNLRAAFADMVLEHFATVDIVEEMPFRAISYFVPGSDDLAVSEAVSRVGGKPSHLIALCTAAAERTWHLSESLLVPIGPEEGGEAGEGELAAWRIEVERLTARGAEIARERDELRERQMMMQDRNERLGKTVSTIRKDVERYLRQISDDAAARELLALERDQLRRKLAATEAHIESARREIDKQKSSVQALRKEVARLRAARGNAVGSGHEPT